MKSCDEMVNSLLERRDKYNAEKKRKRTTTVKCVSCVCLVALLGVGIWRVGMLGTPTEFPPITSEESQGNDNSTIVDTEKSKPEDEPASETSDESNLGTVLENGFNPSNDADETPIFYCAYKSDKTEFNINDVTLDFYYGGWYYQGTEYQLEIHDFPSFELYFTDDERNKFFVKRVDENFVSDKYSCDLICDNDWNVINVVFHHSESVTIPKEIFTEDVGLIYFSIYSENAKEPELGTIAIAGIGIYYKVIGEQVVLSDQPFLLKNQYAESLSTTPCCVEENEKYILLENEKVHFLPNENILVEYSVSNEESIVDITHIENGFDVISINVDEEDDSRITVELSCLSDSLEYNLAMQLELESGNSVIASLYAIENEYGVFISPFSEDDARERYFDYAIDIGIMTQEDCEAIRAEFNREGVIEDNNVEPPTTITTSNGTNVYWAAFTGSDYQYWDLTLT